MMPIRCIYASKWLFRTKLGYFTIECWHYLSSVAQNRESVVFELNNRLAQYSRGHGYWCVVSNLRRRICWYTGIDGLIYACVLFCVPFN